MGGPAGAPGKIRRGVAPERLAWLRLSLALGVPFRRLQLELTARDFAWYLAYEQEHPYGEAGRDLRAGRLSSMLGVAHDLKPAPPGGWRPGTVYPQPPDPTAMPAYRRPGSAMPRRRQNVAVALEAILGKLVRAQQPRSG